MDWNSFIFFSDPDGNAWTVQEQPTGKQTPLGGKLSANRI